MVAESETTPESDVVEYDNAVAATDTLNTVDSAAEEAPKVEVVTEPKAEAVKANSAVVANTPKIPYMARNILILAGFLAGAMLWWVALTSIINLFRRNFQPRHLITINRIAGIIISALGTYTLLSVIIDL
jgi:hypothetical protein